VAPPPGAAHHLAVTLAVNHRPTADCRSSAAWLGRPDWRTRKAVSPGLTPRYLLPLAPHLPRSRQVPQVAAMIATEMTEAISIRCFPWMGTTSPGRIGRSAATLPPSGSA
jgi:hypothetical protein